jgi:hypothetical protein
VKFKHSLPYQSKNHSMKQIKLLISAALITGAGLSAVPANAQKTDKPDFTYDLGGKIEFMKVTDAGVLLVTGSNGLAGIAPGATEPHFVFKEYGKVKQEELEFVPFSPYLIINEGGAAAAFGGTKKTVIDIITGKIMFATEENGWKQVATADIFLPQNKLVIVGNRSRAEKDALAVGIYDLASGNQESFAVLDPDAGKVRSGGSVPLSSGKPYLMEGAVLVPTTKKLLCVDTGNGSIRWSAEIDKATWMSADKTGKEIYAFEERANGDTRIHKVSDSGQLLWNEERKIRGKISRFEILPQGIAIVSEVDNSGKSGIAKLASGASESKIGFLSASSGADLWEKAPATKGYVQHFLVQDDGILFGVNSGGINKISFDGQPLFKKPLSTGPNIHIMTTTPHGLIYITDTDADILNLTSGESIWNKPIKYKKAAAVASAYDKDRKRYLISTGEELLSIDENTGNVETISSFEFGGKEAPDNLEVRDNGLLLSSDQNVMMLDFDGRKKFHEHYKAPGASTFTKISSGVLGVASLAMASAAGFRAGANSGLGGATNSYGRQMEIYQEGFSDIASASFSAMSKRYSATSATKDAQFILTNLDSGVGLIKVNKDTGKADKEILLKDKKPVYEVDEFGGMLYYQSGSSTISAFKL